MCTLLGAIQRKRVDELNSHLGMRSCNGGVWILQATELPGLDDFILAGDTSLSTNELECKGEYDLKVPIERLDYPWHKGEWLLKRNTMNRWRLSGRNSLVKVYHMDRITSGYPPADNPVAQWIIKRPVSAKLLFTLYKPDNRVLA
ncbi:MAG: hypothetical protein R2815_11500 [Flavobacteriales bacterium]